MKIIDSNTVLVPAGTYILGDPCYAIPDNKWDEAITTTDCFHTPVGFVTVDGIKYPIMGFATAYGDGEYPGTDGRWFPVDAGLIGLVPYDLDKEHYNNDVSHIVVFDDETLCTNVNGVMQFGNIRIDTAGDDALEDD